MSETMTKPRESRKAAKERERAEAIEALRKLLPKGSTVYSVLRHVSRSGMLRRIDFFSVDRERGDHNYLSGYIGKALGYKFAQRGDGLVVGGCGMDMGFHVVHNLSYALHGMNNHDGEGSERSGYTLSHRWL